MSRSLNKVTLIGNLGNDPEVRSTTGGNRVATFSLATSRSWNDASGTKQEKTEWHRCVVWNTKNSQLADIVERYVKKGDKLYVEGRIEYRQWTDKAGSNTGSGRTRTTRRATPRRSTCGSSSCWAAAPVREGGPSMTVRARVRGRRRRLRQRPRLARGPRTSRTFPGRWLTRTTTCRSDASTTENQS